MALLVQAGAQVAWDKDGCKIQHPVHGRLEVKMDQGCPTLEHDVGMKIMLEVEQMMMRGDFAVRMLGGMEKSEKDEEMLKKLQEVKKEFPSSRTPSSTASQDDQAMIPRSFHSIER